MKNSYEVAAAILTQAFVNVQLNNNSNDGVINRSSFGYNPKSDKKTMDTIALIYNDFHAIISKENED